mgnify:CR=1 FL=1
MASFTVKINGFCSGGNHLNLTITTVKGAISLSLNKNDLALETDDMERDVGILLRSFIKESGLTNWAQIKTAVEAKTFKV